MTEARVPVTVEDREVYLALGIFHTCEDRMILAGWADDTPYMQRIARHRLAGVAAGREEAQAEIVRLRGLLIDPGDPAWEDARAVLAAELQKAEMPKHAQQVAGGGAAAVPSWIALNLIAHAAKSAAIRQRGK